MAEFGFPRLLQPGIALCRGMAGAGGRLSLPARPGPASRVRRRGPAGRLAGALARGRGLALLGAAALLFVAQAQAQVLSSRIWPARDYTRLTIESKGALKYTLFAVKDPERVVFDPGGEDAAPAPPDLHGQ